MYNIGWAVGWIGNVAVFKEKDGYCLIEWPWGWKRLTVKVADNARDGRI
jgi:hypothetical protein